MDFLDNLVTGFSIAFSLWNLFYAAVGAIIGTAIGVLPGLGPTATMAILLPVTFKVPAVSAVILLSGIFYGSMYGGSTTSILLNIPGETASVPTCLDGYQMARQGRAGPALGIAALGSFIGGTVTILALAMVAPPLSSFALKFGYPEYSSLILLGLMMAVYLSEESFLKGLIAGIFGLLLGMVGLDPISGDARFTFGLMSLRDGVELIPVVMGLFGIAEVLSNLESPEVRDIFKAPLKNLLPTLADWRQCWASVARGTLLGFGIGLLPGPGTIISPFISYAVEKRVSKHPERFGKGAIEGVAAPETANNAAIAAGFVPLMTLGIPTYPVVAMLFVALMMHGIRPGPMMLQEHPDLFWGLIASLYISNVMLLGLNLPLIGIWVRMLKVPYKYLAAIIFVICGIGAYAVSNSVFSVGSMLAFGVLGYLMRKRGFPGAPLILALLLGPMLERNLKQSLIMSGGDPLIFFQRPISAVLLSVTAIVFLLPVFRLLWKHLYGKRRA
jgi:putative tricarboxylic transport membrane protein